MRMTCNNRSTPPVVILTPPHLRHAHHVSPTMSDSPPADLTTMLRAWREGSGTAFSGVLDQVYGQLKRIAARRLDQAGRAGGATLSPTDLLHEALIGFIPDGMDFKNRAHFYATVSLAIRSILIDHARARSADKRGGHAVHVTLEGHEVGEESPLADLLTLEQALTQLESADPRAGQVMHLTYFGGLSQEEIGELLGISIPTVKRDLRFARAWILKALAGE